jgi:hypothetical protein
MLGLLTIGVFQKSHAEEAVASRSQSPSGKIDAAYRLDFTLNEMEDGKNIHSSRYSLDIQPNGSNEVTIGTRIPIEPRRGEFQYMDVGTTIWSRIEDHDGHVDLVARANISSFAQPEPTQGYGSHPPIKQLKIDASTIANLGTPLILGSVDDPGSRRSFQLQVTVAPVK